MSTLTLSTLGPYQLLSLLGAGGMAEVYRAHDPRLDREVAIKVLPVDLARQPGFLERFRREARNVARLDHPNIVPIYDLGEDGGAPYVVMPLIEGGTLRERLAASGVCSLRETASIIYQVALALQEAHTQGLVHRDVKPANVLLAPGERALLADFGIACALAEGVEAPLTHMGLGVGTAEYMSPEQAQGGPVDHRADVYALGIVFFQALTGRVPFSAADHFTTAMLQIYEDPPAPRSLNPGIPPLVEALILKALEKDPARRFQSAAAFAQALTEAVPALRRPGAAGLSSAAQLPATRRVSRPTGMPRAASGPQRWQPVTQRANAAFWGVWPSPVESEPLTVAASPERRGMSGLAGNKRGLVAGYAPEATRPSRKAVWVLLFAIVLAVVLIGGLLAVSGALGSLTNMTLLLS